MIYFGKEKNLNLKFKIRFHKQMVPVTHEILLPNYYLVIYLGWYRYYIAWSRLKRIVRNKHYRLDNKDIYYKNLPKEKS
jgi:hypothetical protein